MTLACEDEDPEKDVKMKKPAAFATGFSSACWTRTSDLVTLNQRVLGSIPSGCTT